MVPFVSPWLGRHWCWLPLGDPAPGRRALGALLLQITPKCCPQELDGEMMRPPWHPGFGVVSPAFQGACSRVAGLRNEWEGREWPQQAEKGFSEKCSREREEGVRAEARG